MRQTIAAQAFLIALILLTPLSFAAADEYEDTIRVFRNAGESGRFFDNAYGYAVFPAVGKVGVIAGAAHGVGRVFEQGIHVGDTTVTQLTVGFQIGAQAFSQMVFFQNEAAFKQFTSGSFKFGAQAGAVAVTAGATAAATSGGSSAAASGTQDHATTTGSYYNGMAIFTLAKGGLMIEATVGGQGFSYTPL